MSSPGLSEGQVQFLKAMSHRQLSLRAVERAKVLPDAAVIGSAELQRRTSFGAGNAQRFHNRHGR
jgi:hypothetical protein